MGIEVHVVLAKTLAYASTKAHRSIPTGHSRIRLGDETHVQHFVVVVKQARSAPVFAGPGPVIGIDLAADIAIDGGAPSEIQSIVASPTHCGTLKYAELT